MGDIIAIDTETTGLDIYHGARPFFVTAALESGENLYWEWDVDPLTREVRIPKGDLDEIAVLINGADTIVMQNAKFDVAALMAIGVVDEWPWEKTEDTILSGHLLGSNHALDLTSMVLEYLGWDISGYEKSLRQATMEARRIAARLYPKWKLANDSDTGMPSATANPWSFDTWLPRRIAMIDRKKRGLWDTVLRDYSNADSTSTLALYKAHAKLLASRGLVKIYETRKKLLPIAYDMERHGVTVNRRRLLKQRRLFQEASSNAAKVCMSIAARMRYDLQLPKSGSNKSLHTFIYRRLKLPPIRYSPKTGRESLDSVTLDHWIATLDPGREGTALRFVENLRNKRRRDTAIAYLDGYERYWLPWDGHKDWRVLHPGVNPTGTDTLRWSSAHPNSQNVSKQNEVGLRSCFGPAPGREWWKIDAQNLELRIPAFESGEKDAIYVFTHPDEPPYYGSYHLLVADLLHHDLFVQYGKDFKKKFEATWYQWVKNGNFAVIYGAQEATADMTYHVEGAYQKIRWRFPAIAKLADKQIELAKQRGYVETIPDRSVDPSKGYPLLCSRSQSGEILPTVPLNYHVQGTAMWWTCMAMIRCYEYLKGFPGYRITMQVHDELVFDFPYKPDMGNLPIIKEIKALMEKGGEDIGVPTPVSIEYCPVSWDKGQPVEL